MKVLFCGPSLAGERAGLAARHPDITVRGPARCGDILRVVEEGAASIGLVDGLFGTVGAVWHKEILFALHEGVAVAGGSSMGALRAAECQSFGMVGLGWVFDRFARGLELDDGFVALAHAPPELDYSPLSLAQADCHHALEQACDAGLLNPCERDGALTASRAIFYADRTVDAVLAALPARRHAALRAVLENTAGHRKRQDAHEVVAWLAGAPDRRGPSQPWPFQRSAQWLAFAAEVSNERSIG